MFLPNLLHLCIILKATALMRTSRSAEGVVSEPGTVRAGQSSRLKIISELQAEISLLVAGQIVYWSSESK